MDGFVVLVEFSLKADGLELFKASVLANAEASVRDEPGCRRFDVLVPRDSADRIVLYEIYDDEAAFAAHRQTPHFARFETATRDIVAGKAVRICGLHEHAAQ
ncbi:MAG: putative quinol monooxygenase [Inquilinaceae bacterium]